MGFVALDRSPIGFVDATIEPRQDHCTLIERGDGRKQLRHRRNPTGEPGCDNWVARWQAAPDRSLAFEQTVTPHRRVERALGGKDVRPLTRQNSEEFVDDLPMRGEIR